MLVLSRQRDETIIIGPILDAQGNQVVEDIEITVVDIRGDKVRLGFSAPKSVPVHRKEVYDAIKRENREAAQLKVEDLPPTGEKPAAPPPERNETHRPRAQRRPRPGRDRNNTGGAHP